MPNSRFYIGQYTLHGCTNTFKSTAQYQQRFVSHQAKHTTFPPAFSSWLKVFQARFNTVRLNFCHD